MPGTREADRSQLFSAVHGWTDAASYVYVAVLAVAAAWTGRTQRDFGSKPSFCHSRSFLCIVTSCRFEICDVDDSVTAAATRDPTRSKAEVARERGPCPTSDCERKSKTCTFLSICYFPWECASCFEIEDVLTRSPRVGVAFIHTIYYVHGYISTGHSLSQRRFACPQIAVVLTASDPERVSRHPPHGSALQCQRAADKEHRG